MAVKTHVEFSDRTVWLLVGGVVVAAGGFIYWSHRKAAAAATDNNVPEWLQGDPMGNEWPTTGPVAPDQLNPYVRQIASVGNAGGTAMTMTPSPRRTRHYPGTYTPLEQAQQTYGGQGGPISI